ncbi:MAG: cyclase family protein [Burkholderiales bacterium]|nr:cyclase family protein [Burkholderiales bacterium]
MALSLIPHLTLAASAVLALCAPGDARAVEPASLLALSSKSPAPPWPAGDERGMANTLGEATTLRCGWHLSQRGGRTYEASFVRSNAMPKSPFANPSLSKPKPTAGVPFSAHAFNSEAFDAGAEPQQQGTQIDALGHFASIASPWDPKNPFSADGASYYGGYKQKDVKPTADSPLLKLGIEKIPPLITTAVLLDAKTFVGKGRAMGDGEVVTAAHIEGMLKAQGLGKRGILPGDMVWIYTGWSEGWKDGDDGARYYAMAPGLAVDAAKLLATKRIVAIGLDAPFIDAVPGGMLQGKAPPAQGTEPGLPFSIHHYMLSVFGIHHLENLNLAAMAADRVWTSCAMALPSRDQGAAGAVVRPVAVGLPGQR